MVVVAWLLGLLVASLNNDPFYSRTDFGRQPPLGRVVVVPSLFNLLVIDLLVLHRMFRNIYILLCM